MAKVYAFLADGLEEVECLAVVDVLRRSGVEVTLVSVTGDRKVTGSHGIELGTDALFEDVNPDVADVLVLPGGMPGTNNLKAHMGLRCQQAGQKDCGHLRGAKHPGEYGALKGQDGYLLSGI